MLNMLYKKGSLEFLDRHILSFYFICISLLPSACAPTSWLKEARSYTQQEQWKSSLERYEDILISGKGTSSTYEEVSYVIDHLHQDYLTSLNRVLASSNEQDQQEVSRCSLIHELEELVPDQVSIDQILNLPQLLNELQSSALDLRLVQQYKEHLDLIFQCSLGWQWIDAWSWVLPFEEYLYSKLKQTDRLEDLIFLAHLGEELKVPLYNLLDRFPSSLPIPLRQQTSRTPITLFTHNQWIRYWQKQSYLAIQNNAWGLALLFERLSKEKSEKNVCFSCLDLNMIEHDYLPELPRSSVMEKLIKSEVKKKLNQLVSSQLTVNNKNLPRQIYESLQDQKLFPSKFEAKVPSQLQDTLLIPNQVKQLFLEEKKAHCTLIEKQISRESRHLDSFKQKQIPKYMVTLKSIESYQASLEEALSQREELENSLLLAQRELVQVNRHDLLQEQIKKEELEKQLQLLINRHQDLNLKEKESTIALLKLGPPHQDFFLSAEKESLRRHRRKKEIKATHNDLEIIKSALLDKNKKLQIKRQEVTRLSGYLSKLTIQINQTNTLLDEKEKLLKAMPQFEQEPVYTVFRYPVTEQIRSCEVTWVAFTMSEDQKEIQWTETKQASQKNFIHRAYPKYKISQAKVNAKQQEKALLKEAQQLITDHFKSWLHNYKMNLLKAKANELITQSPPSISLEELALLNFLHSETFAPYLQDTLYSDLNLEAPLRLKSIFLSSSWFTSDELL